MAEPASERYPPRTICRLSAAVRCAPKGGIAESHARFIPSYRLNDTYAERAARGGLRNLYIFDFAINRVVI